MNWFLAHWTYSSLVLPNSTNHIIQDVTCLLLCSKNLAEQDQKKTYKTNRNKRLMDHIHLRLEFCLTLQTDLGCNIECCT